jgi:hypothetical protein
MGQKLKQREKILPKGRVRGTWKDERRKKKMIRNRVAFLVAIVLSPGFAIPGQPVDPQGESLC